jgi:peptidoglycan hydrolase-like protein with peptidoglycan-binding domain
MNDENVDLTAYEPANIGPVEPQAEPVAIPQESAQAPQEPVSGRTELKLGDSGDEVSYVQGKIGKVQVTGQFDEKTQARVLKLQRLWGLVPTGVVDAQTWEKIG